MEPTCLAIEPCVRSFMSSFRPMLNPLFLAVGLLLRSSATLHGDAPLKVTLATATPGGGCPVYGAAFKAAIEGTDPSIHIGTVNTKGSAENVPLLEQRKMDLALVQGEAAYEALAGVHRKAPADMKI